MEANGRAEKQQRADWLRNWESVWKVGGHWVMQVLHTVRCCMRAQRVPLLEQLLHQPGCR